MFSLSFSMSISGLTSALNCFDSVISIPFYCAKLYRIVILCTTLNYTVSYYTVLHWAILYRTLYSYHNTSSRCTLLSDTLTRIKEALVDQKPENIDDCIRWARCINFFISLFMNSPTDHLTIFVSVCLFASLSLCLSVSQFVSLSVCLFVCQFVCQFVRLSNSYANRLPLHSFSCFCSDYDLKTCLTIESSNWCTATLLTE